MKLIDQSVLRQIRLSANFTQEYVADSLGVCVKTYRLIETSRLSISLIQLFRFSEITEICIYELMKELLGKPLPMTNGFGDELIRKNINEKII